MSHSHEHSNTREGNWSQPPTSLLAEAALLLPKNNLKQLQSKKTLEEEMSIGTCAESFRAAQRDTRAVQRSALRAHTAQTALSSVRPPSCPPHRPLGTAEPPLLYPPAPQVSELVLPQLEESQGLTSTTRTPNSTLTPNSSDTGLQPDCPEPSHGAQCAGQLLRWCPVSRQRAPACRGRPHSFS